MCNSNDVLCLLLYTEKNWVTLSRRTKMLNALWRTYNVRVLTDNVFVPLLKRLHRAAMGRQRRESIHTYQHGKKKKKPEENKVPYTGRISHTPIHSSREVQLLLDSLLSLAAMFS